MPTDLIIVGSVLAVIWIGILILRVPASLAFFSLLVGQVLVGQLNLSFKYYQVVLILSPLALTIFLLRYRVGKSKLMMEFVPSLCVALTTLAFLYPFVYSLQLSINKVTNYQFASYKPWMVAVCAVIVFVFSILNYPKNHSEGKHK